MHRYVVLMWKPGDSVAARAAARMRTRLQMAGVPWSCAHEAPGIFAIHRSNYPGSRVYVTADRSGVVFGSLFHQKGHDRVHALEQLPDSFTGVRVIETHGRALTECYWGAYTAFVNSGAQRQMFATRDCSGKIPCFIARLGGVIVCFSNFEDAVSFDLLPPLDIDWQLLIAYLHAVDPYTERCGFAQVNQLLAGECAGIQPDATRYWFAWDPREICTQNPIEDYRDAKSALRHELIRCLEAHASRDRNLLLLLSGGFDSAVVLGCAQTLTHRPTIHCLTRYAEGPEEDEREYARLAASTARAPLIEEPWGKSGVAFDTSLLQQPLSARPSLHHLAVRERTFRSAVAQRVGATAIWSGEGGDHLFLRGLGIPFAADFARSNGRLHPSLPKVIAANARYSRVSLWTAARLALLPQREHDLSTIANAGRGYSPFVSEDAFSGIGDRSWLHPWEQELEAVPLGKRWQIREFADLLNRGTTIATQAVCDNAPLLSQPLLELSLRIPTYVHLKDGRHRGLARDAFADAVPERITNRDSKGNTTSVVASYLTRQRAYVRELLMDGCLAQSRILNRQAVDAATVPGKPLALLHLGPLMSAISAEVWVRGAEAVRTNIVKSAANL
jgi:asparagine synthase (glutamine-hydrolysing)